jgi:betaine-aldehyde dehydrogenase
MIRAAQTEEEAVRLANESQYGLAAAVFTADADRMVRVTRALRTGMVWQNCSQPAFCQLPWGGLKKSGVGRELGRYGLQAFLEPKTIVRYGSDAHLGWYSVPALRSKL